MTIDQQKLRSHAVITCKLGDKHITPDIRPHEVRTTVMSFVKVILSSFCSKEIFGQNSKYDLYQKSHITVDQLCVSVETQTEVTEHIDAFAYIMEISVTLFRTLLY